MSMKKTYLNCIMPTSLPEKCPYTDILGFPFSRILTEYKEIGPYLSVFRKIRTRKTPDRDIFHTV